MESLGGCSVLPGKVSGKAEKVPERRSPPFIEGLVGVAHHGQGESAAEQQLEDCPLGGVGVLVLVGHRRTVAAPDPLGDLGLDLKRPVRQDDQVPVVHHSQSSLVVLVAMGRLHHSPPLGEGRHQALVVAEVALETEVGAFELGNVGGQHLFIDEVGINQVVGQRGGESDYGARQIEHVGVVQPGEGVLADHPLDKLAGLGRADDGWIPLHPQHRSELGQDLGTEPVIGVDLCLPQGIGAVGEHLLDPVGEFGGRLVGERQPQQLLGLHSLLCDQSRHPVGDGGGLARPGACRHP